MQEIARFGLTLSVCFFLCLGTATAATSDAARSAPAAQVCHSKAAGSPTPLTSFTSTPGASLYQKLAELDQQIQRLLAQVDRNTRERGSLPEGLGDEVAQVWEMVERLAAEVRILPAPDQQQLHNKLGGLRSLAGDLRRATEAGGALLPRFAPPDKSQERPDTEGALVAADACADAPTLGFGSYHGSTTMATNDGAASCGSSFFSPDLWVRVVAPQYGYIWADTFGSDFDTVVSVHESCPGTLDNEIHCNDDGFGLQAALGFYADQGQSYWLRISGYGNATGDYQLRIGTGGLLAGTVTSSAGVPLAGTWVETRSTDGYLEGYTTTANDGSYSFEAFYAGSHYVNTSNSQEFIDQLYDGVSCPDYGSYYLSCELSLGTQVPVGANGTTSGIDFALDPASGIGGTVTDAASGLPLASVQIKVWNALGNLVTTAYTATNGSYVVRPLVPGSYFVTTVSSLFTGELYDGLPCPGGPPNGCNLASGNAVEVAQGTITSGIDFQLQGKGSISGRVTDASGNPLQWVNVSLLTASGYYVAYSYSDSEGYYELVGLNPGTYWVRAEEYGFVTELYDDKLCLNGSCPYASATPIVVSADTIVTGIDFQLSALGSLSGTVTDVAGNPLSGLTVVIYDSNGYWEGSTSTSGNGDYAFTSLYPGSYFVRTSSSVFFDEVYDDLPCPGSCSVLSGTPIVVGVESQTSGIDFALRQRGTISGSVRNLSGAGIPNLRVQALDLEGDIVSSDSTDSNGDYLLLGLGEASYLVRTTTSYFSEVEYQDEVYDDIPCTSSDCDLKAATPVAVAAGSQAEINFSLHRLGAIAGTVADDLGAPICVYIQVYTTTGSFVDETQACGSYIVKGLSPGSYLVKAYDEYYPYGSSNVEYLSELFDNVPCSGYGLDGCNIAAASQVSTVLDVTTSGVSFRLNRLARISGQITDAETGAALGDGSVKLWDSNGLLVADEYLYSGDTAYSFGALLPGVYYLTTAFSGYANQLYQGMPCQGSCTVTDGTPVGVGIGTHRQNVDFALEAGGSVTGRIVNADTQQPLAGIRLWLWNSAGQLQSSSAYTDEVGRYRFPRLSPSTYFVGASDNTGRYMAQLYRSLPCPAGFYGSSCKPTKGRPVVVGTEPVTGIDFALIDLEGPTFPTNSSGMVVDALTGAPLAGVSVDLWSSSATYFGSGVSKADGTFVLPSYSYGTYYVSTDNSLGYVDQLFNGVLCPQGSAYNGLCSVTQGTPIMVSSQPITGIHFALGPPPPAALFSDGFESGSLSAWSAVHSSP